MFFRDERSLGQAKPGTLGLVKPSGTPTMIPNSLRIIFYAFDTGTAGIYSIPQDCAPGHAFNPSTYWTGTPSPGPPHYWVDGSSLPNYDPKLSLQSTGTTSSGTATLWGGGAVDAVKPGAGALVGQVGGYGLDGSDAMRAAVNLQAAGAGASFTMFATHMQTGGCQTGLICGRGCDLDNNGDICAIHTAGVTSGDTNSKLYFGYSGSSIGTGAGSSFQYTSVSTDACGLNTLCTTVVTCTNTGSASPNNTTDIKMYVSVGGAAPTLEAHTTGATMYDVSAANSSSEDQFQIGTMFHSGAGQQQSTFNGYVFQCGISNKLWSSTDVANFAANPYQYLTF